MQYPLLLHVQNIKLLSIPFILSMFISNYRQHQACLAVFSVQYVLVLHGETRRDVYIQGFSLQ